MGIFDRFKKPKKEVNKTDTSSGKVDNDFKIVLVDKVYLLDVPNDWKEFKSDRFRMKNPTDTLLFSAANYGKPISEANGFGMQDLKTESEALFVRFEKEGGYEPIDDKTLGANFIYQAFKVDFETQYYFYTFREAMGKMIRINFIIREKGEYKIQTKDNLLKIGNSIKIKVA